MPVFETPERRSSESARAAIVGLGTSQLGRVFGKTSAELALEAVSHAVADAGLALSDVDGLLTSDGIVGPGPQLAGMLGLSNLRLNVHLQTAGATAGAAVQYACMAVISGMVETVLYVHADAPLRDPHASGSDIYSAARATGASGFAAMDRANGLEGANERYALAARRHMEAFGTTSEQLGSIAVAQRAWATMNPLATMREPITLEDHQRSRWIAEPLHLLDCCLVSNGAVAVVITSQERASSLTQPPVYVWGWGQSHPGQTMSRGSEWGIKTGATESGRMAFEMAGIGVEDIDIRELYDCYTFTALITLEDYGFVDKGEGGPLAATGALGPGGSMPTNTGGGQLSSFYLWGATPLHEAVVQTRGQAGERQVASHDFVLCSGNGGQLERHSTLILGAHPRR